MVFLFPSDYFSPKTVDAAFLRTSEALEKRGFKIIVLDLDGLKDRKRNFYPPLPRQRLIIYKGWMLTESEYKRLYDAVCITGGKMLTDPRSYIQAHHLPNWYPLISHITPETHVVPNGEDVKTVLNQLGWKKYFIKDYVKALKTEPGAILTDPNEIDPLLEAMKQFRGEIEGGICIRRYEKWVEGSEKRYFVINGKAFGADASHPVPLEVQYCAHVIQNPFFSVDVALDLKGRNRIVEVGDGQVSDLVGWSQERFAEIWFE